MNHPLEETNNYQPRI